MSYDGSLEAIFRRAKRWHEKKVKRAPDGQVPVNHTDFAVHDRETLVGEIERVRTNAEDLGRKSTHSAIMRWLRDQQHYWSSVAKDRKNSGALGASYKAHDRSCEYEKIADAVERKEYLEGVDEYSS